MALTSSSGNRAIIVIAIMALIAVEVANGFVPAHERPQRPPVDRYNPSPDHQVEEPETHTPPSRVVPGRDASQTEPLVDSESDMQPFHSRRPNNPRFGPSRSRLPIFNFPTSVSAMIDGVGRRVDQVENDLDDLNGNVDDLYREVRGVTGRMTSFSRQMVSLQSQVRRNRFHQQENLRQQAPLRSAEPDIEDRVSRLEAENQDLRRFLETFETFFQRLMSDNPAAFDPTAAPEERISRLHQYLGNAEAELMSVSQRSGTVFQSSDKQSPSLDGVAEHPSEEVPGRSDGRNPGPPPPSGMDTVEQQFVMMGVQHADQQTVSTAPRRGPSTGETRTNGRQTPATSEVRLSAAEADRLAVAMEQLSAQNSQLTTRLQMLEQQAAGSNPPGDLGAGAGATIQGMTNEITNELLDKVDRLEQVVALQASSILDSVADAGVHGESQILTASRGQFGISSASSSSRKPSRPQTSSTTMNEEDTAIMKEMLEETRDKGSSSRKSAFSVARTTPLIGSSEPQRVSFDHVYVNKGRDFDVDNSTFVCERAGFYFISFNLRSYDDHFLGVALMKNDEVVTAVYTDADSRNVMESQSVVVHLSPGDALSLRLGPSERFGIHSNFYKYVTFSGFMIYSGY